MQKRLDSLKMPVPEDACMDAQDGQPENTLPSMGRSRTGVSMHHNVTFI